MCVINKCFLSLMVSLLLKWDSEQGNKLNVYNKLYIVSYKCSDLLLIFE